MTEVKQKDNYHCVPACLESILGDLKMPKTQEDIVEENPEYFHYGKENQGALLGASCLESVIRRLGIAEKLKVQTDLDKLSEIAKDRRNIILLFYTKVSKQRTVDNRVVTSLLSDS